MQDENFRKWLRDRGVKPNGVNTRSHAVRTIERKMAELGSPFQSLEEAHASDDFAQLRDAISELRRDAKVGGERYRILLPQSEKPLGRLSNYGSWLGQYGKFLRDDKGGWPQLEELRDIFLERMPDFENFEQHEGRYWEVERAYKDEMLAQVAAIVSSDRDDAEAGHAIYDALLPQSGPPLRWQTINAVEKQHAERLRELETLIGRLARSVQPAEDAIIEAVRGMEALRKEGVSSLTHGEALAIAFSVAAAVRPKDSAFFKITKAQALAKTLAEGPTFGGPTVSEPDVRAWLDLLHRIQSVMRDEWDWRPRDLLDVQSFAWVVLDSGRVDEDTSLRLYDEAGTEHEPVRQQNMETGRTAYRIKPPGASNATNDAEEKEDLLDAARALLLDGRPVRVAPVGTTQASYLVYGPGRKLCGYRLSDDLAEALGIAAEGGVLPQEKREPDADRIRRFVLENYIEPAREAGDPSVTVLVRDVNEQLQLKNAWPNICQALGGPKMQELADVGPPERIGALQSAATKFRFVLVQEAQTVQPSPTNLILYGPPGTGKTYATAEEALRLCGKEIPDTRHGVMAEYQKLRTAGQIEFVTFHQSFSYEDFVEGLRPTQSREDGGAGFELQPTPGVFRRIARRAETSTGGGSEPFAIGDRQVFKMSIGEAANPEDAYLFEEAMASGHTTLGFADIDWSDARYESRDAIIEKCRVEEVMDEGEEPTGASAEVQMPFTFRNKLRTGDLIVVSKGNLRFRAIGEVTGDYEFRPRSEGGYAHRRAVRWLWVDQDGVPVSEIYGRLFMQKALYRLAMNDLNVPALERYIASQQDTGSVPPEQFVLIIDEINRANISKVFGELITLLEPDKRLGQSNAITVRLPYSGEVFGVPANLHILGTMNTADRSIALLDTALRRRFKFRELMPQPDLLESIEGIDVRSFLSALNERIEYLFDREHQIGHAYFMGCESKADLDDVMRHKVIPLLAEYFYEDWSKVAAVLGDANDSEGDRMGRFLVRRTLQPPRGIADFESSESRYRWSMRDGEFDYSDWQ